MYLLDTVVVSALRRPERHVSVARWLQDQPPQGLYISVITVGEIMYGVARQRRTQPAFAELLDRWLESVATSFHDRILPFDEAASRRWGLLHAELNQSQGGMCISREVSGMAGPLFDCGTRTQWDTQAPVRSAPQM